MKQKANNIFITLRIAFISVLLFLGTIALGQPLAKFTATPATACAPVLIQFTDLSTGGASEWKWDLGNGTISYLQNPSVTYFTPGKYTVKLMVKNSAGADSVVKTNYITVNAAPVVNFSSSVVTGCNPLVVNFTDLSTTISGTVAAWQWDFGDGSLSSARNPTHTYIDLGNYNVTLKVINNNGCVSTLLKPAYIKVNGVEAGFSFDIPQTCSAPNVHFQNISTGTGIVNYQWSFGDGSNSAVANPSHIFLTGGNYIIKLIARNNNGCVDSATKNIRLDSFVSAAFTANATTNCKAPFDVHFTNQALSGNSYLWYFGDSTSSSLSNPLHVFTDTGSFSVKLVVTNINGCIDSLDKPGFIKINKPSLKLSNLPDSGCLPLTKRFSVDNISRDRIVSYSWDFGDGTTSSSASPFHVYNSQGYFNVYLMTTSAGGCRDTVLIPQAIRVTSKPIANFTVNTRNVCGKTPIIFTNLSTGGASAWAWFFGDGSMSFEENPEHSYKDTGYMNVMLVAMNGGCSDTVKFRNYIYIKPAIANFNLAYNCASPNTVKFTNISKGGDEWYWDFGDSTYSSELNPTHTYIFGGQKIVQLRAVNLATGCDHTTTKNFRLVNLKAAFSTVDTIACKGVPVFFTSPLGSDNVGRFIWDFGDGQVQTVRDNVISHIYQNAGNYSIKLTIINRISGCRDSLTKHNYIKIEGPVAKFGLENYIASVNSNIVFLDSSESDGLHPIQSWKWDFENGFTDSSTHGPFTHIYTTPGFFFVKLLIKDTQGCVDSTALVNPLVISETKAKFISADTVGCPGSSIRFTNFSNGNNLSYNWNFGDGDHSTEKEPTHVYNREGNFDIKLVVTDQYGFTDSTIKIAYISLHEPVASFNMSDSFRNCPPLIIQFTDASSNTINKVWDFGDGASSTLSAPSHFYTYPGNYFIKLTATGPGGCSSTMTKQITVKGPRGSFTYDPLNSCKPYHVNFVAHVVDAVSYVWDFNDGNTLTNMDTIVAHTFTTAGNYLPKLMLIDSIGCRIPITGIDTVHAVSVTAKFNFADSVYCNSNTVSFANLSSSGIENSYYWNFGDGTFSTEKNPLHQYTVAGNYTTSLKVKTAFGCEDSIAATMPVRIGNMLGVNIFTSSTSGCTPLLVTLKGLLPQEYPTATVNWQWSFGNENTSTLQIPPPQNYTSPGVYTVILKAANSSGCSNTISKTIEVFATPVLDAGADRIICKGANTVLQANGGANYNWSPAEGLSCTTCASPVATPLLDTKYTAQVTTVNGCSASDSVLIKVKQPLKIGYRKNEILCIGQSRRLTASGAATYNWSPATGLSNAVVPNPLARPDSTTTYRVIGTDDMGCFKDTGFVKVQVYQYPTVEAGEDKTVSAGHPIDLIPLISSDVTEVNWSPTSGIFRNSNSAITVKPMQTTEYKVEVKNEGGCLASDRVTVSVLCDGSNVFIPNTFSPNNDGANDIFYPRGTGLFKIKTLRIFNRWGEAVFEKTNFNPNDVSSGWNGTFKGKKANADVYIYFIEIICNNNSILNFNGNVALVQ